MRLPAGIYLIALSVMACLASPGSATAQTIVLLVNGEPVTSHDIVQRMLYRNLTSSPSRANAFFERVKAVLTNDSGIKEKARRMRDSVQPRTQVEAQKAAERIKKALIEDAVWQVLSRDGAAKGAVIESVIGDRLKLQAAKRFGIDITDEQVEKSIIVDRLAAGDVYAGMPEMNAFYARREEYGISRKTIREIMRAELAWRAVINRIYGAATGWQTTGAYESFALSYLGMLRQHAIIEHRG
jgi:peptidyl-prolyl cis-trans isomerase SurA